LGSEEPIPEALPTDAVPGLWTVNLDPRLAVEQFGSLRLKRKTIMRSLLNNRAVRFFVDAIPGLESLAMLGRIWHYTIEEDDDGSFRFHTVILETPGLGRLVRLLRLPEIVLDSVPDGPLRNDAHQIASLLRDPERCSIAAVTLAEELPVRETLELERSLVAAGHHTALTVVNGLYPSFLTQTPLLDRILELDAGEVSDSGLAEMIRQARLFQTRRAVNETWLQELLNRTRSPCILLNKYFVPALGFREVTALAEQLGHAPIIQPDTGLHEPDESV
jgi:anion-transporting  ArsA/GET3 family ATPase